MLWLHYSILFQSACTGYVRPSIRGIPNGMDLYEGQYLVLECENWRSPEREQTQIDGKLKRSVGYSQHGGPIPKR